MRPSVTYYHPWCSKTREGDLVELLAGTLGVSSSAWQSIGARMYSQSWDFEKGHM